jgi:hypothetical protein
MEERINDIRRSKLSNNIALHSFEDNDINLRELISYIESLFLSYNIHPIKVDITGENGVKGNKVILYKNAKKKLELCDYKGVDGIWIGATPSFDYDDNQESIFMFDIALSKTGKESLVLTMDEGVSGFDRGVYCGILKNLQRIVRAKYGYIYQRPFNKGPQYYPYGIIMCLERGTTERKLITRWSDEYHMMEGSYKVGDLRDVYDGNVIVDEHLERRVGDKSLREWIESDSSNGYIEAIDDKTYVWWAPEGNIEKIRGVLRETGILICV